MRWFGIGADRAEAGLLASFCTVLREGRTSVGGGVYLRGRHVITCAHVVNAALGRDLFEPSAPGDEPLTVAFGPLPAEVRCRAWVAPRSFDGGRVRRGSQAWGGDIALLTLAADPPPDVVEQHFQDLSLGLDVRAWYGNGERATFVDAAVRSCGPGVAYLDRISAAGPGIGPGFSGGPLWSPHYEAVVGLVVGQLQGDGWADRSLAIPWQTVRGELAEHLDASEIDRLLPGNPGAAVGLGTSAPDSRPSILTEAERELARVIRIELGAADQCGRHARAMAKACDLSVLGAAEGAPGAEELASVLLGIPRALAAFTESLRSDRPATSDLLIDLGIAHGVPGQLSPAEHSRLVRLLDESGHHVMLGRACRAALPELPLPEEVILPWNAEVAQGRVLALLEHLEQLQGHSLQHPGTRLVPPLLRLVEYHAAQLTEDKAACREDLQAWARLVTQRLGVACEALLEHRAAAARWAETLKVGAARRARVAVGLTRYEHATSDGPGRFRCTIWTEVGDGVPRPSPENLAEPLEPNGIARLVRAVVAREGADALIEFFLDTKDLGLAVEDWDSAEPDDFLGPEPLGLANQVVIRFAGELSGMRTAERRRHLNRRWPYRDRLPSVHLDEAHRDPRQVRAVIERDQQAARMVVRCPDPGLRLRFATVCLVLGMPIVLWERDAQGPLTAEHFKPFDPDGPSADLAERIRQYRAGSHGDDGGYPLRPVLAQEHPEYPAPAVLELTDPEEQWVD